MKYRAFFFSRIRRSQVNAVSPHFLPPPSADRGEKRKRILPTPSPKIVKGKPRAVAIRTLVRLLCTVQDDHAFVQVSARSPPGASRIGKLLNVHPSVCLGRFGLIGLDFEH